ncbi:Tubulin tyrosine ligase like 11, partial [Trichostrongylus colubriformis]
MKSIVKSPRCRVNKFPGMTELSKKVSLTHAIDSMRKIFPRDYNFYPPSYFLPAHLDQFKEFWHKEMSRRRQKGLQNEMYFIVKPDDGAQGSGIYLINDPDQIRDASEKQLVQEYVADPFLMNDQLKFDFRVYGVIKSINPLSIYVSREGMVRFCTEKYRKPKPSNFDNLYAHLTNYSLNKGNLSYIHSLSLMDQINGSKRLLSTVFGQMAKCGLRTKKLWHDIKIIIVKTVLAMLPELMINYEYEFNGTVGPQCFQ